MRSNLKILLLLETSRAYGRRLLRSIARYAMMNGPWEIECQTPFYLRSSQTMGDLPLERAAGFDGIIMREQRNIEPLIESGIPIVFASYLTSDFASPMISTDDVKITSVALNYFLAKGFTQFAFVGYDGMFWSDKRKASFEDFVKKTESFCHIYNQAKNNKQKEWESEQYTLANWLKQLPKPIALLACNDDRAQQVLLSCRLAGISVPEEIVIMGIDNDEFVCTLVHPPLSSIDLNTENVGYEAASVLDRMMHGEKISNLTIPVYPTSVVTRQSSDILAICDTDVASAVRFIRENIRKPIQIDDVLGQVAISRRSLHEKFKQYLGCSLHQYIKKQRIARIEQLLLSTDMTISQIAYHMGFRSDEHIAAYFRSVKAINPYAFRLSQKAK